MMGTMHRPAPQVMTMARAESAMAGKTADMGGGLAGAEKAELTARVTLAATVPAD